MLEIVKIQSEKQFYVFYDEWTGNIINITTQSDESSDHPHLLTDDKNVEQLVKGHLNENDYMVSFDDDNNLAVIKRNNKLRLRSSESNLRQIPRTILSDWDIRVQVYSENNKLVVEVNPEAIRRLSSMTFNKQIIVDDDNDLSLYLIKYNAPDYLIETIAVDAQQLLDNGNIVYDIANIRQHISLTDLGILTRRCFKNYDMQFIPGSLNIIQHSLIKNKSYRQHTAKFNLIHSHIEVEQQGDILWFSTMLSSGELADIGLHEDRIALHITGDTPDDYYGSIPVNIRDLKTKKRSKVIVEADNFDITDYHLWHKKHRVVFSIKGTQT